MLIHHLEEKDEKQRIPRRRRASIQMNENPSISIETASDGVQATCSPTRAVLIKPSKPSITGPFVSERSRGIHTPR
jgi:hypothetical protein